MFRIKKAQQFDDQMVLEVTRAHNSEKVRLKEKEWELLLQINGIRSVSELVHKSVLEKSEILSVLGNLHQKNLIKVTDHADKEYVDNELFKNLEQTLTEYIGPVASFVIDEMLIELNEDRSEFSSEKLPLLVEMISRTIEDDVKRINYQNIMLKQLRKL